MMRFLLGLVVFTTVYSLDGHTKNSEIHFQLKASILQKLLNEAVGHIDNENLEVSRTLPNYKHAININLNDYKLNNEMLEYAHNFARVDKQGMGSLNILIEKPQVKGEIFFNEPLIEKEKNGRFFVTVDAQIKDYQVKFDHVWFTSQGLIELDELSENSCHNLISSQNAVEGEDFLINANDSRETIRSYLNNFYKKLSRESFKGHEGNLWARVDNFQIGWGTKKYYNDSRNILRLKIKALIDPKTGGERVKLVSFSHNLNKKGGAKLPIYMPASNIILPPTFIRTQSRKIVDGLQTNEEIPRCTFINDDPVRGLISSFSKEISKQISIQLTDTNVKRIIEVVNEKLKSLSIPALPESLSVGNEDNRSIKSQANLNGRNFYFYQDVEFDFNKDLYGLIQNFTTYRAALGFDNLEVNQNSNALDLGLNSELIIDGTELRYREDESESKPTLEKDFKWSYDLGSDASVAINGKFLNKIINPIKDHFLKTKLPDSVNVYMEDNLFQVDRDGRIDITPRVELDIKDIEILRISFNVKAKPSLYHGQDGKSWVKMNYDVPNALEIINSIQTGKVIRAAETVTDIILWPFYPLKEYVIKPKIKEAIRWRLQSYIDNIKNSYKEIEITNFVKTYGILPSTLKFHKLPTDNYMELKLNIRKFYGLDKVMKEIK
jgi:hypothetical protein